MDPIAFAVPVFMGLFGLEVLAARRKGAVLVRFADSMSDLSCGVMQQVLKIFLVLLTGGAYIWVEEHAGLLELSTSDPWVWAATFFGVDFCYYWFHRLSHQINFLWAAHVVHHQSEEYNLSVALRQSALQPGFSWVFYIPLAVIGVPPLVFFVHVSVNTLYQFWIHTRLIGRMGPLELFLNTPSHHRVHHGQNPQYIDRNHAGTLIIWDKLFGTFEPEGEEVIYGITEPAESFNPFWVNLHSWVLTFRRAARTRRWGDKVRLFLKPPGWLPEDLKGDKAPRAWPPPKYDPAVPASVRRYTLWQFVLVVAVMPGFLLLKYADQPGLKIVLGAAVLAALASLNGLNEGKGWARWLEGVRLLGTTLAMASTWPATYPASVYMLPPLALWAAVSAFALLRVTRAGEATRPRAGEATA